MLKLGVACDSAVRWRSFIPCLVAPLFTFVYATKAVNVRKVITRCLTYPKPAVNGRLRLHFVLQRIIFSPGLTFNKSTMQFHVVNPYLLSILIFRIIKTFLLFYINVAGGEKTAVCSARTYRLFLRNSRSFVNFSLRGARGG